MKEKELVLKEGTKAVCINDCYQDAEEDEDRVLIYIKDTVYTATRQGFLIDEEGCSRQWKADWFTLSPEFHIYFKIIN